MRLSHSSVAALSPYLLADLTEQVPADNLAKLLLVHEPGRDLFVLIHVVDENAPQRSAKDVAEVLHSVGERRTETDWFPVVAWGRTAEICQQLLSRGSRVFVSGRLQTRRWEDQDGGWHGITEVNLQEVILLERREPEATECGDRKTD